MGYKFEPKLFMNELGDGKVKMIFQYKQKAHPNKQKLTVNVDVYNQYRLFACTPSEKRFEHLANALNWDINTPSDRLIFAIYLLMYFPFGKSVPFKRVKEA